jgi:transcriptional regulator with XRE-family HTH domain
LQTIYERIEFLIASKKLTKKAFCEDIKISTGNLGDWRTGKTHPSANILIDIAKYFDVSLDWLMIGKDRMPERVKESGERYFLGLLWQSECHEEELSEQEKAFIKEYIAFSKYRKERLNEGK